MFIDPIFYHNFIYLKRHIKCFSTIVIMVKINRMDAIIFGIIIFLGVLTYLLTYSISLSIIPFIMGIFYLLESK